VSISIRPSAVSPRKNANQAAPKAKITRPVLMLTSYADRSASAFRLSTPVSYYAGDL
jgi:hypothetical protein